MPPPPGTEEYNRYYGGWPPPLQGPGRPGGAVSPPPGHDDPEAVGARGDRSEHLPSQRPANRAERAPSTDESSTQAPGTAFSSPPPTAAPPPPPPPPTREPPPPITHRPGTSNWPSTSFEHNASFSHLEQPEWGSAREAFGPPTSYAEYYYGPPPATLNSAEKVPEAYLRQQQAWGDSGVAHDWEPDEGDFPYGLAIGLPVGIIILCALLIAACCLWRRRRRQRKTRAAARNGGLARLSIDKDGNAYVNYGGARAGEEDPWQLEKSRLVVNYDKKLGSGAFCNVFMGRIVGAAPVTRVQPASRLNRTCFEDCEVAVKTLPNFADAIARSDLMQEINFMKSLAYHPHLVSMLGWVDDGQSPLLIVELCERGDLLHYIREKKEEIITGYQNTDGLKHKDVLSFAWQIANGLEYLNSVGCIHRDIAARNVLVNAGNVCKIGDFGLCRLTETLLYQARGGRLPLKWMAPEALASLEYSFKSDVWSFAVLLWELFSFGEVPFATMQTTELLPHLQAGNRLPRPEWCTPEVYDVMLACWNGVAAERPSFTQLVGTFAGMLERATESYGYLVAVSAMRDTDVVEVSEP